jgi:hypothetical protein
MGLGTPLRPSRLAFSWTPDSIMYDLIDADASFEHYEHQHPHLHPRYAIHLPSEEIEQWSERIVVDETGYHMQPAASSPSSSPPMHPADKSGSSASSLDFEAADETIALESLDAADLDLEDEDEEGRGGEILRTDELQLPPGLHGPTNGRRGRTSYYLPRPPAEIVNAANGRNSPYRYRPGCANAVYEDPPSSPLSASLSASKPDLSLKTHTSPRSRGYVRERHAALLLDSPTQAVPRDAVDLEAFGNGDVVVGTVGVPQNVGLGVMCPPTPVPRPSSVPFLTDDGDTDGQDVDVDAEVDADADAEREGERESEPSLSPSHSSDSASVNTVSTGGDDLAEVAMAQIQVRAPGSREEGEIVTEGPAPCGKPPRPPRNPSRIATGGTATAGTSDVVFAEGWFVY